MVLPRRGPFDCMWCTKDEHLACTASHYDRACLAAVY